eukprot:TRINITY_DN3907_c0_g1_i1.p2 TRINITY_DN3907_c0_g1~~TRINITY_DN3907_c0_g1_i1.p2  ORF type:complete len:104 (+),score=3.99 TRINITY_DN3907_c0_g1_i1:148-459(+)
MVRVCKGMNRRRGNKVRKCKQTNKKKKTLFHSTPSKKTPTPTIKPQSRQNNANPTPIASNPNQNTHRTPRKDPRINRTTAGVDKRSNSNTNINTNILPTRART